jgi:hypothetical protein
MMQRKQFDKLLRAQEITLGASHVGEWIVPPVRLVARVWRRRLPRVNSHLKFAFAT